MRPQERRRLYIIRISFHSVELVHKYVICVVIMESSTYKIN